MGSEREALSSLDSDIKATADDIVADAERLAAIEVAKKELPPGDPQRAELAGESATLTSMMASKARIEQQLVETERQKRSRQRPPAK